ncbi:hypothetical protein ACLOJK_027730 [Asimina triloba]
MSSYLVKAQIGYGLTLVLTIDSGEEIVASSHRSGEEIVAGSRGSEEEIVARKEDRRSGEDLNAGRGNCRFEEDLDAAVVDLERISSPEVINLKRARAKTSVRGKKRNDRRQRRRG